MPLTGTYERAIDQQLRVAIPKAMRQEFCRQEGNDGLNRLFLTPGFDGVLNAYCPSVFETLGRVRTSAASGAAALRKFARLFYAQAYPAEWDGQGRIRIPERLAAFADLRDAVVLVGVNDHIELWAPEKWHQFMRSEVEEFDRLGAEFFGES
ncbi:MAG: hypothetical protein D6725_12195 [Planctomycetota bacterium]|nr:MAG: hypothetical protein D6725_12195 [Planctomycetota bacterium]